MSDTAFMCDTQCCWSGPSILNNCYGKTTLLGTIHLILYSVYVGKFLVPEKMNDA